MRKSSASNRIRLENKCISFVLVLAIGLIELAPCMAVQEFVLLEGRSASVSSSRSVVEINESLFEGLAYEIPFSIRNNSHQSFRVSSATSVCNCVSASFDGKPVLDGDELHCKVFIRPKGPEMLQVIELKGFEEGSEVETRLLRFKVDVKVLSPLRLESQSIVIKDGVPSHARVSVLREEGIEHVSCEVTQHEMPFVIAYQEDGDKLLLNRNEVVGSEAPGLDTSSCQLLFAFKFKGKIGKVLRTLDIGPPKSVRVTPNSLTFRRKDNKFYSRFILSNLAGEANKSDSVELEWQDEKGWHAIANDFHSDKLSEQRMLCWIVISEEIAIDKIRSLRIKLNRSLDPLIEVPVQFAQ